MPKENQGLLVYSAPVALYLILRFLYLIKAKPDFARKAEKLIFDKGFLIGFAVLGIIILITLYVEAGTWFFFTADI